MERIRAKKIIDLPQGPCEGVRNVHAVEENHLAEPEYADLVRMDRSISRHDLGRIHVPFDLGRVENHLFAFPDAFPIIP